MHFFVCVENFPTGVNLRASCKIDIICEEA